MSIADAIERLALPSTEFEPGQVWLAGAGPGNAGSLTLDVAMAISSADAIVYDALVNPAVLELANDAELIFVGKRGGRVSAAQEVINEQLIRLARAGKRVLRLKGGDPHIFGRGGEEIFTLAKAGIAFRVLPGITSAFAAMAQLNIPATMRGRNRAIILATGHAAGSVDDVDWKALAVTGQPVIVYMGLTNIAHIARELITGGMAADTPAAVIMAATMPGERILVATAGSIADEAKANGFESPSLLLFGSIVSVREELSRLIRGPVK